MTNLPRRNIISFINMKGGVCKTTLCKEMANYFSSNNKKVLVIDIDPQANCTQSLFEHFKVIEIVDEEIKTDLSKLPTIQNLYASSGSSLEKPSPKNTIYPLTDNLHIIPGELKTIFMERETSNGAAEQKLFNFIDEFMLRDEYNYIFIDCPPTYSFYTISALLSSDFYFVPVIPDAYSMLGVDMLKNVVKNLKSVYRANFKNQPLDSLGIIFTKIDTTPSKGIEKNMSKIIETFKDDIYIFKNKFLNSPKMITSNINKLISDRTDIDLKYSLESICIEFDKEVSKKNGTTNI